MGILLILVILGMVSSALSIGSRLDGFYKASYNVIDFGAVGDGHKDDSQAFINAWNEVCAAQRDSPSLVIPKGHKFLLGPTTFEGPCKPLHIYVRVYGEIVAPRKKSAWEGHDLNYWLMFSSIDGLTVNGNGQINGLGSNWWHQTSQIFDISDNEVYGERPTALHFFKCNDLKLHGLNLINSPSKHVSIYACNDTTISNLHINAPKTSPNTDGILISQSSRIQVHDCTIATGDDCVAVIGNSSNINITRVACGPGHGISIGSLGGNGVTHHVEDIHIIDCSFDGTLNGVRIKTWQGGSGYARKISFQGITLKNADNPIIIDQFYCPLHNCPNKTEAVKVSDISYTRVQGTSIRKEAINFSCSQSMGCSNIVLDHINITYAVPKNRSTYAYCFNAQGRFDRTSNPRLDCLSK